MVRTKAEDREVRGTVEIACDESGFVGGSLFGATRVFAHASVHLDLRGAIDLADEVRTRTGAGSHELKASRLNRPWGHPVAEWLCGPDGPLQGRAFVHVTDTRLFGLFNKSPPRRSGMISWSFRMRFMKRSSTNEPRT